MINGMLITIYAKTCSIIRQKTYYIVDSNVNDSLNLLSDDNLSCVRIFDSKIRSIFQYVIHNILNSS